MKYPHGVTDCPTGLTPQREAHYDRHQWWEVSFFWRAFLESQLLPPAGSAPGCWELGDFVEPVVAEGLLYASRAHH